MQSSMLEKKRAARTQVVDRNVPFYGQSSKLLANEKKKAGLDEMLEASKEGGAGKAGRR